MQQQGTTETPKRRMPIGAEAMPDGRVHFRVWAPESRSVAILLSGLESLKNAATHALQPEKGGYFASAIPDAKTGMFYRIKLDSGSFPDPASRFQPQGPHGPSEIIDPLGFKWTDASWPGVRREGQVIYEMHVGTFTPEGTWSAAMAQLPHVADLGVTLLEIMPVADFSGRFGWGYDGVNMFAPTRLYGRPDDLRAFVNRAHELGLGVILDVVYNHFGPDGNYLAHFSKDYFSSRYQNEWGEALNFDGPNSQAVREFFITNARYWTEEYHFDGLRLDATQQIFDSSPENVLVAITRAVRVAGASRGTYIVAENEWQHVRLVRPSEQGGYGLDSLWNDDFHHSARVAATGRSEAYYTDYKGAPQEFISAMKWGYIYQGQHYKWQKKRRGTPALDLHPAQFVTFLQNHDQVANSLRGQRLHMLTNPGTYKALTALLLLGPATPMLFQGQEFAASSPFFYFADHNPELAKLVAKGRAEFLRQFPSIACAECDPYVIAPEAESTFLRSKLDLSERDKHQEIYDLHRDLLRLRRDDPVFSRPARNGVDGAVLGSHAFLLRYFGKEAGDRLLLVNLGQDLCLDVVPEPLLAPPDASRWEMVWSSESPRYGGCGTPPVETDENWQIPGQAAVVLVSVNSHGKTDSPN
jgi:maltooligosyltrehalose trehalohydrolase